MQDRVVLEAVPIELRGRLLDRLEAVWRADQGEPLGTLAELAGLKRAAFYNLRAAWRKHSLAGLVPHDARAVRRVVARDDDPQRERASALLRADPLSRNVDIARSMMDSGATSDGDGVGPHVALTALQRLERLVRDERRRLAADPAFLRGAWGRGLILDLTAVSIILKGASPALAVAAILMETSSGIVMGSAVGARDDGVALQRVALDAGLEFLRQRRADLPPSSPAPDLGLMLPPGFDEGNLADALKGRVGQLTVGRAGGFSFGQQVVQVTGPRVGRMPLQPRRTLAIDMDGFLGRRVAPTVDVNAAGAIWAREVERHNGDRIAALVDAGVAGHGPADGRLASALRVLLRALQPG